MTAAIRRSFSLYRLWWALAGVVLALAVAGGVLQWRINAARADTLTAAIPPAKAAALVNATSGAAAVKFKAVGEDARLINAGMPFAKGGPVPSRPFDIAVDGGVDHRRALLCMTQAVYYEAGYEPVEGRRAVAQVVLNRMRHPAYPKSVCGVVYQGWNQPVCQFSFVCDGALYRRPEAAAWRTAQAVAAAALSGYVEASVGSATHYHADYVAPYWAPMLGKVAKIGAHIFYRWPGAWGQQAAFTGRYIGEPRDPSTMRPPLRQPVDGVVPGVTDGLPVEFAGPPISRAPNDVGGLLDTSKGWTLNIPLPSDASSASRAVAERQKTNAAPAAPAEVASATAPARVASR